MATEQIVCTAAGLQAASACYKGDKLNPIQQQAILVWAKVKQLATYGGTDYSATLTTDLLVDSACPPQTPDDIRAAHIVIALGQICTDPGTIQDLMEDVKCLQHSTMQQLMMAELHLDCLIGQRLWTSYCD
jgi:hypothetical protein